MSFLSHGFGRLKDLADIPSTLGNEGKYLGLDGAGNPIWDTPAGGSGLVSTFEIVNKNLYAYPAALNYNGSGDITSVVYTVPGGTITKTLNYTSGDLTSIVLSGNTPAGINLTKTLNYTAGNLTGVSYS